VGTVHLWTFYICRLYFVIPSEPERSGGDEGSTRSDFFFPVSCSFHASDFWRALQPVQTGLRGLWYRALNRFALIPRLSSE
jgi:hypothetical protein